MVHGRGGRVMTRSVRELLLGMGAYAPVPHLLEGLEPGQWDARPEGVRHSLYDQLWHLVFWQDWEVAALRGEPTPPVPRAADSWPASSAAGRPTPEQLGARFEAGVAELETLSEAAEARATAGAAGAERAVRVRSGITVIVAHTAYHAGQMVLVRQLLGAWPPPRGGDSW